MNFTDTMKKVWFVLKSHGISRVDYCYSGSGDSGSLDYMGLESLLVEEVAREVLEKKIVVPVTGSAWDRAQEKWIHATREEELSLIDIMQDVAERMLNNHFGGWEINEGSEGTVSFIVNEYKVVFNHREVVQSFNEYTRENDLTPSDLEILAIESQTKSVE